MSLGDVLVTGGAGFVGSNLVGRLLQLTSGRITIVDNLLSSERSRVPTSAQIEFIEGSIADDAVLARLGDRFDTVFHLSTYHGNQSSIHDPLADHANNTLTTLKLGHAASAWTRLKAFVYAGAGCTAAVKTWDSPTATTEDAPLAIAQDSPYSISKLVGEMYCLYFHRQGRLPAIRARFQNVYGPGEILGAGRWRGTPATVWRNVVPTFIYKALAGSPLPIDGDGAATRDFIHVRDICEGLLACAARGRPGEAYNLASGVETSIATLAATINELSGNAAGVAVMPMRPWDSSGRRYGSTVKSAQELGFVASTGLRDGLADTISWTRANLDLIGQCIQRHARHLQAGSHGA